MYEVICKRRVSRRNRREECAAVSERVNARVNALQLNDIIQSRDCTPNEEN